MGMASGESGSVGVDAEVVGVDAGVAGGIWGWAVRWGTRLGWVGVSLTVGLIGLIAAFQERIIYLPVIPGDKFGRSYPALPDRYSLPYEDVWMTAADGTRLHGWLMLQTRSGAGSSVPTLLFLHENAGNIAHRLPNLMAVYNQLRCNVFILSYRGFGASEGSPSEAGLRQDARAALRYLHVRPEVDASRIVLFGRSLGGAVALDLFADRTLESRPAACIVENTFTSIADMAGIIFPPLRWAVVPRWSPVRSLIRNKWETLRRVRELPRDAPVLFVSSGRDELVPPSHMRALFEGCPSDAKDWVYYPNGGHMDLWFHNAPGYWRRLSDFIAAHCDSQ